MGSAGVSGEIFAKCSCTDAEDDGFGILQKKGCAMLAHCDIIAFIATAQSEQAKVFYSQVLELPLLEETPFALVFNAHGTMLRIQKVETLTKAGYTALGWHVGDLDEAVEVLRRRGILFERYAGLPQDEQGIWTTPEGNKIAWFSDPDGNTLSLTEIRRD